MQLIPESAVSLIKVFEGCKLTAYQDSVGIWTIGYGSTENVHKGLIITQQEAEARLLVYLNILVKRVTSIVRYTTENQLSALLSFTYNLGIGTLKRSTLRQKLNRGEYEEAADEFPKYCFAGGKKLKGLLRRRLAEQKLFQL